MPTPDRLPARDTLPIRPFGSWPSPISVEMVVAGSLSLREVWLDGADTYWIEVRPDEGGRSVVVRRDPDGTIRDVTPPGFNARTMVHEYGGAAYTVDGGTVIFSNKDDGRLYRQARGAQPEPLTAEGPLRYADLRVDRAGGRVLCVREDHREGDREAVNAIVSVNLKDGATTVLVHGADFYSHPRLDPSGRHLAWMTWDHPNMPWDSSEVWVAAVEADGSLTSARRVAGGPGESVAQPEWAPDGSLVFCSDRSGWWNPYRWRIGEPAGGTALAPKAAEFVDPQWVFGQSTYAILGNGDLVAAPRLRDGAKLMVVPADGGPTRDLPQPLREVFSVRSRGQASAFIGAAPTRPTAVVEVDVASGAVAVLREASKLTIDAAFLSEPQAITFPTEGGLEAHALLYRPTNPTVRAPAGERPPLILISHGGPTGNAETALDMEIQYFTSRGFAVVDVDYGGSTGYGRAFRERLVGTWGIVDVEDCTNAARYLARDGLVDAARLFIRGGSAGGYTTLRALTSGDTFAAGASYYGVGDLGALARDTHKFESRYLDGLVGPYPAAKAVYDERSPINATDRLSCPLIIFQGLDDRVVPPAQAEALVAALDAKGLPYAYLAFAGEGHGFRRAESIRRALEAEVSFYSQLFGFELADPVEPVAIENLGRWMSRTRASQP